MSKYPIAVILRLLGICLACIAIGTVCLIVAYEAFLRGELKIPKSSAVATPLRLPAFYYGFMMFYAIGGLALVVSPIVFICYIFRATPEQREGLLTRYMPTASKRPPRILRTLLIFVVIPLVAIFIIMFATILKSS